MAYMEGNLLNSDGNADKKRLAILSFSCILLIALIVYFSGLREVNFSIIGFAALLFLFFAVTYFKLFPMAWTLLFNKHEYDRILEMDKSIIKILMELDDSYFILANITMELFHVEYLIVSGRGIFVIARAKQTDDILLKDGVMVADAPSLDKITSGLWRICHFLNIVIKKSFKVDLMPQPVVVLAEAGAVPSKIIDDLIVCTLPDLKNIIHSSMTTPLPDGIAENLAYLLKTRYVKK